MTLSLLLAAVVVAAVGLVVKDSFLGSGQKAIALTTKPQKPQKSQVTVPAGWKLTFSSNFTATTLNTKVWATCYWWAIKGSCTNYGSGGVEKEWYQPSQVQVSGGVLSLTAQREKTEGLAKNGKPETYYCRSGMVTTAPGFNFEYGILQVRARLPYSDGLWPALWLAASNRQWPPEIDLLEHWDSMQEAKVYLHPKDGPRQGGPVFTPGNLSKGWHSFTLYWTKSRLSWYIDGVRVFTTTVNIPSQKMYLIANLADSSTAPGACSGTMLIQSVRVWQPA